MRVLKKKLKMDLTTSDILNLYNYGDFSSESDPGTPSRAKKRRLDHLSWEEKLQRK